MKVHARWLIDDARHVLTRAWSMYAVYLWVVIGSALMVAPLISDAAQNVIGPWWFGGILFLAATSFGIARVKKQPGTEA